MGSGTSWSDETYWVLNHFQRLNVFIGTYSNTFGEHISKAGGFVRFFCVETEHGFVYIPFKVYLGDEVIGSEDNPLEMSPKALNAVGCE